MLQKLTTWQVALVTLALGVTVWTGVAIAQSRPQDVALQEARRTVSVGNLKEAVAQFKTIIAKYPDDRATTASALLGLADCYRRLGDVESQKIYARIIAEFSDQRQTAAEARARLAPGEPTTDPIRRLWTVPADASIAGAVSYDGRYVAYVDWSNPGKGDLFLHSFAGGADRRLTQTGNSADANWKRWADSAVFSRDGRQVAYSWVDDATSRWEIRIVGLTGTATPQPKVLVGFDAPSRIDPYDWSADGKWIAAMWKTNADSVRIGMISTADGSLRELKTIDRPCACADRLVLSPNGKYLAYDYPGQDTKARDIYVIDVATAVEHQAVVYRAHDTVVGWSPDGASLIFTSDRRRPGTDDLWSVPIAPGKIGAPQMLRSDLGPFGTHGITATGAVFYCRCEPQAGSDIKVATFDFNNGTFISPPADAVQQFVGTNTQPFWSPDGKSFLYRTIRPNQDPMIAIQDVATGEVRELRPHQITLSDPRWAPDGKSFAVLTRDFNDVFGYSRIDATTGALTKIITYPRGNWIGPMEPTASWSKDGSKLFFRRYNVAAEPVGLFVEVDVATGREREIIRMNTPRDTLQLQLARDHKTVYYRRPIVGTPLFAILARDMENGNERELLRRERLGNFNISHDGKWLGVGLDPTPTERAGVLLVPTAGGEAVPLFTAPGAGAPGAANLLSMGPGAWAPDDRSMIIRFSKPEGAPEFMWVPLDNRQPRKLVEFDGLNPAGLRIHPDGQRILFGAKPATPEPSKPMEFWVLEGVLKK